MTKERILLLKILNKLHCCEALSPSSYLGLMKWTSVSLDQIKISFIKMHKGQKRTRDSSASRGRRQPKVKLVGGEREYLQVHSFLEFVSHFQLVVCRSRWDLRKLQLCILQALQLELSLLVLPLPASSPQTAVPGLSPSPNCTSQCYSNAIRRGIVWQFCLRFPPFYLHFCATPPTIPKKTDKKNFIFQHSHRGKFLERVRCQTNRNQTKPKIDKSNGRKNIKGIRRSTFWR